MFVSILLFQLANQGKVGLDDRVTTYLPDFTVFDPFEGSDGRDMTLRHLSSQLSGLGRASPDMTDLDEAVQIIKTTAGLLHPVGAIPQYSNLAFTLLGQILAQLVIGTNFSDAVATLITQPLGIEAGTGVEYTAPVMARLATSYLKRGHVEDGEWASRFRPVSLKEGEGR
jgi:CubicO group peptidase (beta-lactamase class C family)